MAWADAEEMLASVLGSLVNDVDGCGGDASVGAWFHGA